MKHNDMYMVIGPTGYLYGPFNWNSVEEFLKGNRNPFTVYRLKAVAKYDVNPKLEML